MSTITHLHSLSDYLLQHPNSGQEQTDATLFVPSSFIGCYQLDVSEVPKRFLAQALPAMLEDLMVDDIDGQHLCQGNYKKGQLLPILAVSKEQVQEWIDSATSCGLNITSLYPDFYALPYKAGQVALYTDNSYAIARTDEHQGFSGTHDEVTTLLQLHLQQQETSPSLHLYGERDALDSINVDAQYHGELRDMSLQAPALDLRQGQFSGKPKATNPYKGLEWVLGTAALLVIAICINNLSEAKHYKVQHATLLPQVQQDYQRLFSKPPTGDWFSAAKNQANLAQVQLTSPELNHWRLIENINAAVKSCRSCQIDELTVNKNTALLTVKKEGSDPLVSRLKDNGKLNVANVDSSGTAVSIKLTLVGA